MNISPATVSALTVPTVSPELIPPEIDEKMDEIDRRIRFMEWDMEELFTGIRKSIEDGYTNNAVNRLRNAQGSLGTLGNSLKDYYSLTVTKPVLPHEANVQVAANLLDGVGRLAKADALIGASILWDGSKNVVAADSAVVQEVRSHVETTMQGFQAAISALQQLKHAS